jgi:signal transduction histidine kinase
MANRALSLSLKARVMVVVIGLIVAGILGFAARIAAVLRTDLEALVSTQLEAQVGFVVRELDSELQFRIDSLHEIAASLPPELFAEPDRLQHLLLQRQLTRTLFPLGLTAVDRDGRIVADYAFDLPFGRSGLVGDRDYFRQVLATGRPVVGGPVRSRFADRVIIPIAVPAPDRAGGIAGVLVAPTDPLAHTLFGKVVEARIGKTGKVLVMSARDNLIVAASETERIMTAVPGRGVNPLLDRRLYEGYEGSGVTVNSLGVEVVSASRNMKTTGWTVIASISTEEAFAPIQSLTRAVYLGAAAVGLALALALALFLRREMRPLEEAGAAMRRMTDGGAPLAELPVGRADEIGRLLTDFNHLIVSLKEADGKIRSLNQNLEQRVQERTRELQQAIAAREEEIAERVRAERAALSFAERLQVMTRRLVKVQEWERHKLAAELHDRVSSNLATLNLDLKHLAGQPPERFGAELALRLDDLSALIADTVAGVRDIVSDLHPPMLDYGGLYAGLADYLRKFERRTGIACGVSCTDPDTHLSHEQQVALFRITQEALMNCAKHGAPGSIEVRLTGAPDRTRLTIWDDGKGFDLAAVGRDGRRAGLGLLSMQERAEAVGGRLLIESAPGRGTRITVEIAHAAVATTA